MHATTQNTSTSTSNTTNAKAKRRGDAARAANAELAQIPDALAWSGLGRSTFYKKAAAGDIRMKKMGSRSLVVMSSLRDLIAKLPEATLRKPTTA